MVAGAGDSPGSVIGHGVHGLHDALGLAGGLGAEVLSLAGAHEARAAGTQVQNPLCPPDGIVQLTQLLEAMGDGMVLEKRGGRGGREGGGGGGGTDHIGAALYDVRASYGFCERR